MYRKLSHIPHLCRIDFFPLLSLLQNYKTTDLTRRYMLAVKVALRALLPTNERFRNVGFTCPPRRRLL